MNTVRLRTLAAIAVLVAPPTVVLASGCAQPCVDDGLGQRFCPEDDEADGSGGAGDAWASASAGERGAEAGGPQGGEGDGATGDTGATASDTNDGTATAAEAGGGGCGAELFQAVPIEANVLIVLDRSGSMNNDIGGGSKWDIARAAIGGFVSNFRGDASFGLMLFPGENLDCSQGAQCEAGTVFVDTDAADPMQIVDDLAAAETCSFRTPIAETLAALIDYPGLQDATRENHVLLVTDGQATCGDPVPEVANLLAETPSVRTFVVGFGDGVDPDELADMARAGGTERTGMGVPAYFQADDAASLSAALNEIGGNVLSCSYMLDTVPADLSEMYVFFDGVAIPRDEAHGAGWDIDPSTRTMTFYGAACDRLQAGSVGDLEIVRGC